MAETTQTEERTGPHAGESWPYVWGAFRHHYDKYRTENPNWRAFFTEHHMYALDEALREYDQVRGEVANAELMELAEKLDSEASVSARPGQLDRLEEIASQLRRIARTPRAEVSRG
ncbi:hypothetical protein [Amycolatopsis sp. cmx-4-83]|uniref:hypothetical protein n=1 Tax=Amycolatopsis sp. cmx-4-83 TaxID=2790940 RepID=UPI00397B08CB